MTSFGLDDIMKNLLRSGAVTEEDVVIFDRCLSPFVTVGTLEACVEAAVPEIWLAFPAMAEQTIVRSPSGPTTLVKLPVVNTTVGAVRMNKTTANIAYVDVDRMEMLQIDRPEDMTIAQAVTMFGDDK